MFERAIVRNPDASDWSLLTHCVDVVLATEHAGVLAAIEAAERRAQSEALHAVGYVAYEASHAFDSKFPKRILIFPLCALPSFLTKPVLIHWVDCMRLRVHRPITGSYEKAKALLSLRLTPFAK